MKRALLGWEIEGRDTRAREISNEHNADLIFNQRGQGKVVEKVCEHCPHIRRVVFPDALFIKAVDLGNLPALMISSDHRHSLRITHLLNPPITISIEM